MKKINPLPYGILFLALFLCFLLPKYFSSGLRAIITSKIPVSDQRINENTCEKLQCENGRLKTQLDAVLEWLLFDARFEKQVELLKSFSQKEEKDLFLKDFFQRRAELLAYNLKQKLLALPCQVILRDPISWSSFLWVNVGKNHNESLGKLIISKHSLVMKGNTLVGIVEEVLADRSRVRLITDSSLVPSVRAVRGRRQKRELAIEIAYLIDRLKQEEQIFNQEKEKEELLSSLTNIQSRLIHTEKDLYLAKGYLEGSVSLSSRKRSSLLKGEGFNYAFPDEEGSAKPFSTQKIPLIAQGDLLVTTGYDGIFPKDLEVAIVMKVYPLEPADGTYKIEAKSTAGDLDDLQTLYILPPIE